MPDIVLFGATGFTGRLTAQALARRNASFAIAGRSRDKLERLAQETGHPEIRVAQVGDTTSLARALGDARALITCVGPFVELGETAVEAALQTKTHYIDSTGEGVFIEQLIRERGREARAVGIAMAPAMGFDEVPADVAATLATEGLERPDLVLTYAVPSHPSLGTAKTALRILPAEGRWIRNGKAVSIRAGERERWAPMPPPLGPRRGVSFPLAEGHLAPLHIDLNSLELYATVGRGQRLALKALPAARAALSTPVLRRGIEATLERTVRAPEGDARKSSWTILAEARSGGAARNVVLTGRDVYGLTAELLATAALHMSQDDYTETGVLSPVQAVGLDQLQKELLDNDVSTEVFES